MKSKFKKVSSYILSFMLIFTMIGNISVEAAHKTGISSDGTTVRITTQGIPATTATTYHTVGWTVNYKKHNMIMDKTTTKVENLGNGASKFTLPLAGGAKNSIYGQMGGEKAPEVLNLFYNGGTLNFNARMMVYKNGNPTGKVYTTQQGIANAQPWSGGYGQFNSYFNQKLYVPPQDVLVHLKVAHQLLDESGNRIGPNGEKGGSPVHSQLVPALAHKGQVIKKASLFDNLSFSANNYEDYEFAYSCFSPNGAVGTDTQASSERTRTFNFICPNSDKLVDNKGNFLGAYRYMIFYYKPKNTNMVNLKVEADGEGIVTGGGLKELSNGKATFDNITAQPKEGFHFQGWTVEYGDKVTPDSNNQVTITKDTKLVAHFSNMSKLVNLSVRANPLSAGKVTGGGNKLLENGKATFTGITQTPKSPKSKNGNWVFTHWSTKKGDKVVPKNGTVSITQDTVLIANYKLEPTDKQKPLPNEYSDLRVTASIDRNPAKEGQLITFTIDTYSNDYKKPITDSRGWDSRHTPRYVEYGRDSDGFNDILSGLGEEKEQCCVERCRDRANGDEVCHTYCWYEYYQEYLGTVYRKPIQWFSAEKIRIYFPKEISTLPTLNDFRIHPYVENFVSSTCTYEDGTHAREIIKHNQEKIEFYLPLEVPITIRNNGARIRQPYKIRVEAIETNGKVKAETYVNLDIKGNIYEGIKTTPIGF